VVRGRAPRAARARRGRAQLRRRQRLDVVRRLIRRLLHPVDIGRTPAMTRPITLFTGQWADLPLEEVARLASVWGYDGLEIAYWGAHLDPWQAAEDDSYIQSKLDLLEKYNLSLYAISNHLKGQAVCDDPIDARHQAILPARVWGDGEPEGVRQRAAEEMKLTARTAQRLGVKTVIGFTGSRTCERVHVVPRV